MKSWIKRWFGQDAAGDAATAAEAGVRPFLPSSRRLYCVGDIHGRLDLLEELHELIVADAEGFEGSKGIIYLGDYIDRGSQSKQVLDLLIEQPLKDFDVINLLGNHEQTLLDFIEDPQTASAWLDYGGQVTLLSYGVGFGRINMGQQLDLLRDELQEKIPTEHIEFLQQCQLMHREGSYCFVHAGIRPGVDLDEQSPGDIMWIRDEFIRSTADHGHIIVHGHSMTEEVEWQANRIGIDTGAYNSGMLTALVLEGEDQRLLQTGRDVA